MRKFHKILSIKLVNNHLRKMIDQNQFFLENLIFLHFKCKSKFFIDLMEKINAYCDTSQSYPNCFRLAAALKSRSALTYKDQT